MIARMKLIALLAVVLVTPAAAQQCPPPPFYALLPHNYPCSLIRTCSTDHGICAIPFTVLPGTPCSCQAQSGAWIKGVCVR
jgi:hypothetical protein